jgi:hypothetical protein
VIEVASAADRPLDARDGAVIKELDTGRRVALMGWAWRYLDPPARPIGYRVQPGDRTPASFEVDNEIVRRGYRPLVAGDPMDETMQPESLRVMVQIGMEYLARLGGAKAGELITADTVNRGLVAFLRDRDQYGTGQHP